MKTYLYILLFVFFISCKENKEKEKLVVKENTIKKNSTKEILASTLLIDKKIVLGEFNYRQNNDFEKIKSIHSSKTIYLNKKVYKSFIKMFDTAKKDGIDLKIISGTRNYNEQKIIWERKWKKYKYLKPLERAKKILEFSSMPTTSRHHWGTDIDLNNLNNSYFERGKGKKEYDWLVLNANKYGFYQVYTKKNNGRTGYNLEKWHWSYLPLASKYLNFYNKNITYNDIKGFKGSELAEQLKMINNYVNGISDKIAEYKQ